MPCPSRQSGFTLLEVLIAMVVLSISLIAVIKVVEQVSLSATQLRDKTYAQWVALNEIAEIRLQPSWPSVGKTDGDSKMAGQNWHWVAEVKNTEDQDVRKLEVSVKPASESDDHAATVVVTAFLGKPL